jgi:hypothetical protein
MKLQAFACSLDFLEATGLCLCVLGFSTSLLIAKNIPLLEILSVFLFDCDNTN